MMWKDKADLSFLENRLGEICQLLEDIAGEFRECTFESIASSLDEIAEYLTDRRSS
jgi:hypothetical protein